MYQILVLLITCAKIIAEDLSITISSGAFFNEVKEVIVYEKSIALIYTQRIITEEPNFSENLLEIGKYCENKKTSYCYSLQQSLELLKTLNTNINENTKNMETLEEIIGKQKRVAIKKKRYTTNWGFLQFLL